MKFKDVPNLLSVIRILLVPVFVYLYMSGKFYTAVFVFIVAGITDVVDGYIARRFNFISNLGKVLDPFADKLMQFVAFICLAITEVVPVWMPVVYFLKELGTLIGALFVFRKAKIVVKSRLFGKLATFFVFSFVSFIIAFPELIPESTVSIICALMCLYFVFSCVMYAITEIQGQIGKSKKENGVSNT